jgi:hypothetical protein
VFSARLTSLAWRSPRRSSFPGTPAVCAGHSANAGDRRHTIAAPTATFGGVPLPT